MNNIMVVQTYRSDLAPVRAQFSPVGNGQLSYIVIARVSREVMS